MKGGPKVATKTPTRNAEPDVDKEKYPLEYKTFHIRLLWYNYLVLTFLEHKVRMKLHVGDSLHSD